MVQPSCCCTGSPTRTRLWRHQMPARWSAPATASSRPTCAASATRRSLPKSTGTACSISSATCSASSIHSGCNACPVVGHDWGAALAWAMAAFVPDRVDHLVALSVGHPSAFRDAGLRAAREVVVHAAVPVRGHRRAVALGRRLRQHARAGPTTPTWTRWRSTSPARAHSPRRSTGIAPTCTRARWIEPPLVFPQVQAPTMGVWSSGDFALDESGMTGSQRFVDGPWRYERIEDAGHWMQLEAPDQVSALLVDFLPAP